MKYIKQELSLTCMDLGSQAGAKTHFFQNLVMLHMKLKGNAYSNMVANTFPADTCLAQVVGSKRHFMFLF